MSKIEWTEKTWNPFVGCTKAGPGCANCYALGFAVRHAHNPSFSEETREKYRSTIRKTAIGWEWSGKIAYFPERLQIPLRTKKPTLYFVGSMGDLFHPGIPDSFRDEVYATAALCPHVFLLLTKRAEEMARYWTDEYRFVMIEGTAQAIEEKRSGCDPSLWLAVHDLPNVWNGFTACNQEEYERNILYFLPMPGNKFISFEPLLGPIDMRIPKGAKPFQQAIIGSESIGRKPGRECKLEWIEDIVSQCDAAGIPVMVKQAEIDGKLVKLPKIMGRVRDELAWA